MKQKAVKYELGEDFALKMDADDPSPSSRADSTTSPEAYTWTVTASA